MTAVDPFMGDQPTQRPGDFRRSTKGTPYVSDPYGAMVKPKRKNDPPRIKWVAYKRPSGFGKQIEDTYNLNKWSERMGVFGFAIDPTLVDTANKLLELEQDSPEWRAHADGIVAEAKRQAKAGISAERGTHTHALTEDDDEGRDIVTRLEHGETLGLDETVQRSLLQAWRDMLARNEIEILLTEATVVNDEYRAAGTIDRLGRLGKPLRFALCSGEIVTLPAGWVGIVDIKTGQRRIDNKGVVMYWQSYAVQVALYAGSVLYDTDTNTRAPMPWLVDQRYALIAHLDVLGALDGTPSCELVLVDIRAGRHAADVCVAAKEWESRNDVFSVAQIVPDNGPHDVPVEAIPVAGPTVESAATSTGATLAPVEDMGETSPTGATRAKWETQPARLALVDARNQLATDPDQGQNLTDPEYDELWNQLRGHYDRLELPARAWRARLAKDAKRRGVTFLAQDAKTERVYHINRGLVALALVEPNDDLLRMLVLHVLGDVAVNYDIEPGHLVGSLTVKQAERFAGIVDEYLDGGDAA